MRFSGKRIEGKGMALIAGALLLLMALSIVCILDDGGQTGPRGHDSSEGTQGGHESWFVVTRADLDTDGSDAVSVDLSEFLDGYTITEAGSYILTGTLGGSVLVDAEEQVVHIILHDAYIRSPSGPALEVRSAGKVVITVDAGTENTLRDSGFYQGSGEENACVFSVCDLTFNGSGRLNVQGYYKDGIHSKDVVKMLGGEVTVWSKRDGIRGNDGILVDTDRLDVESEGSGLHTTKTGNGTGGAIEVSGGKLSIISGEYAIEAAGSFYASGCSIYEKGILANHNIAGETMIQEGCLEDE